MPRIRTIKPEFWTDSKTGTLNEFSKCLFIGLLNYSDDYGLLEWDPAEWRAKLFPYHYDSTPTVVISALTGELLPKGLIQVFTILKDDGALKKFAFIRNFGKHQVINNPSNPLLDDWKKGDIPETYAKRMEYKYEELGENMCVGVTDPSRTTTVGLLPGKERKGKERRKKKNTTLSSNKETRPCEPTIFQIIIEDLNQQAEKKFRYDTKSTKDKINARLNEGYTVADFKEIHRVMVLSWGNDPKMRQFLRPETLYAASHFESYLNQPEPDQPVQRPTIYYYKKDFEEAKARGDKNIKYEPKD